MQEERGRGYAYAYTDADLASGPRLIIYGADVDTKPQHSQCARGTANGLAPSAFGFLVAVPVCKSEHRSAHAFALLDPLAAALNGAL